MTYTRLAEPQTAWARHLDRIRRDHDWSAVEMFEDAFEALGLGPKSINSFKPVLVDQEPPARWVRQLAERYGEPTPEDRAAPTAADLSLQERAVLAAEAQVEATRENTAMLAQLLAALTNRPAVDPRDVAEAEAARERLAESGSSHPQRRLTDAGMAQP